MLASHGLAHPMALIMLSAPDCPVPSQHHGVFQAALSGVYSAVLYRYTVSHERRRRSAVCTWSR
jgi:hypothetical protein